MSEKIGEASALSKCCDCGKFFKTQSNITERCDECFVKHVKDNLNTNFDIFIKTNKKINITGNGNKNKMNNDKKKRIEFLLELYMYFNINLINENGALLAEIRSYLTKELFKEFKNDNLNA